MDHSLVLTKKAASIVDEVMGSDMSPSVYYSGDGNQVIMEFHQYPIYGSGKAGTVYVQFPRSTFTVRNGMVVFKRLAQAECRFYQNKFGEAFAHPHIFSDGHPCWHGGDRSKAVDFILNIIETLCLTNVTQASIYIGHRASAVMAGNATDAGQQDENSLANAGKQAKLVAQKLHVRHFIFDRRQMEAYVSKRWVNTITDYMKTLY